MTQPSVWMNVDTFTVEQAAALWCGLDPSKLSFMDNFNPPEFLAAKQMLSGAIIAGKLPADALMNPLAPIGNHAKTLVTRSALEAFARAKSQYPAFLFDTLIPFTQGLAGPTPSPEALIESRLKALRRAPVDQGAPVNQGGRPPEYDWDTFTMEIIRRADSLDGLPKKQAELVKSMLGWFSANYNTEPADSSVKKRISKIYKYLADHKSRAENSGA